MNPPGPAVPGGPGGLADGPGRTRSPTHGAWSSSHEEEDGFGARAVGGAEMDVEEEVKKLVEEMTRLGERDDAGVLKVKFGVLFRDEACQQIFEALIGTARGRDSGPLPWRPPGCPVIFPAPSTVFCVQTRTLTWDVDACASPSRVRGRHAAGREEAQDHRLRGPDAPEPRARRR